jgi:2-polyprenyl-3-methyl-5-hydroxy-6-metoxy-1,4-benzoquinol methylase
MNLALAEALCREADRSLELPAAPESVVRRLPRAVALVEELARRYGGGSNAAYLDTSRNRYAHYQALAELHLPARARVLDLGNAPGHFASLLSNLGHDITGVNLNTEYRTLYPDPSWVELFHVVECDVEREELPFPAASFDAVLFTEVLEHLAITDPVVVLGRLRRVLRPGGVVVFSTPNVCNLSNVIALLLGVNVFWPRELFYGSLDRHNREWTPAEVLSVFAAAHLRPLEFYGMSDHSNWRGGGANDQVYALLGGLGEEHALLRNTIVGVFTPAPPVAGQPI